MICSDMRNVAKAVALVKSYSNQVIEASVIEYICGKMNRHFSYQQELCALEGKADKDLLTLLDNLDFPICIEYVIAFFEALLEKETIEENGIVFTPRYIADYINECVLTERKCDNVKVIDPGCGCGIFLVSAVEKIKEKSGKSIRDILKTNIFGMDIDTDNARRCKIVLNLFAIMNDESNQDLDLQIVCCDSLKVDWNRIFNVEYFDCVIGNPPYVNTHDMSRETALFLKNTFQSTKTGVYNIFYAFVEYGMQFLANAGKLSYIVPNNFLSIKSAKELRELLVRNRWIEKIVDFSDNMVFKPVRTYNCIIQLGKEEKEEFEYSVVEKTEDIPAALRNLKFDKMALDRLDTNCWQLVDKKTRANIMKIEGQFRSIKDFVRTGIATLRDEVYMVEYDGRNYYKDVGGVRYVIEKNLVKRLYKIPDLKQSKSISSVRRYIIFPYKKSQSGFEIIPEDELREENPKTYAYLLARKAELNERDKGKPNAVSWYAYGRTQGLNRYGNKLLFPTFASVPRFTMVEDEYALFCNGYAVFENDYIDLEVLRRILNSVIMQYYVNSTSYAIEGGYYCYQKKYIEKFSVPYFSDDEKVRMMLMSKEELDTFLIEKYGLAM